MSRNRFFNGAREQGMIRSNLRHTLGGMALVLFVAYAAAAVISGSPSPDSPAQTQTQGKVPGEALSYVGLGKVPGVALGHMGMDHWDELIMQVWVIALPIVVVGLMIVSLRRRRTTPAPGPGMTPPPAIAYPQLTKSDLTGLAAETWIDQGRFNDKRTYHGRDTPVTYEFECYEYLCTAVKNIRPRKGAVLQVHVWAQNPGDIPEIAGVSGEDSQKVDPKTAFAITDEQGKAKIDIYIPDGEFSDENTLVIMVKEVEQDTKDIKALVYHNDVTIGPPR